MHETMGLAIHLNNVTNHELERWADTFRLGVRAAFGEDTPDDGELSVTFVSDDEMAALNEQYLHRAGPTDVIAFHLGDEPLLGDVYISVDTARRQALLHEVPVEEELLRLVVHGALHVRGYDHPDGESRYESPMFRLQESLVRRLLGSTPER